MDTSVITRSPAKQHSGRNRKKGEKRRDDGRGIQMKMK
jgi:hypothetical protein